MIYTLTISPSLDFINEVKDFSITKINRSSNSFFLPGGKGINVSLVLKQLEIQSIASGFKAGFTGEYLEKLLEENNISNDLIEAEGLTRINTKVIGKQEVAINTDMLIIKQNHIEILLLKFKQLNDNDILVISGNIPSNISQNLYENIIENINKNVKIIVDAESKLLLNTLKYNPFLIKPNRDELSQIFNVNITSINEAIFYAKELRQMGAQNVIVSLDKDGAILVDSNNHSYIMENVKDELISSVGAGDSLIAGFIAGIEKGMDYKNSFILGIACANATAFSKTLANKSSINKYLLLLKEINN